MVRQLKEAIILFYLEPVRLHLEYCAQFCAPEYKADTEVSAEGQ